MLIDNGINGIVFTINGHNAKHEVLTNKKQFKPVTEPFYYNGTMFTNDTLKTSSNKFRSDTAGNLYIVGARTVWQLMEI